MTSVVSEVAAPPSPMYLPRAEAALVGLSMATVFGFWRLFDNSSFLVPMLTVALLSHLVMILGRRRGWSVLVTALVALPVAAVACSWLVLPDTTVAGLPTAGTVSAADQALRDAWQMFNNVLTPTQPVPGFVLASCAALFFAVYLADWAAFRLWSSFEAIVPAITLFIFCALLGAEHREISGVVFVAALLLFLLLHRLARQESGSGWLTASAVDGDGDGSTGAPRPTGGRGGRRGPVVAGVVLVAVAVLGGYLVGPRLPGAGSPAVVALRSNGQGPGERKAVSPLVRIRDRLVNQPNVPLFTVRANEPSYWRLTSLETFDGEIWKSQARYGTADGDLPGDAPDGQSELVEQAYSILNLDMIWAPAAYRPVRVIDSTVGLNFNDDSSTLIVESGGSLQGTQYAIQSRASRPTAETLRSVTEADIPQEIRERYLSLPDDFSSVARQTAISQTRGLDRPYDVALALQQFFRNDGPGGFEYDTNLDLGHSESAIDTFLKERRGFCEQFAGTYAAMARAVGLPARVAVGFTQGVAKNPDTPNVYEVTGRQTHAWPEVFLGRFGWVMFEPTPGRGAPNTGWTNVPQDQDDGGESFLPPRTPPPQGTVGATPIPIDPAPPTSVEPEPTSTTTTPPTSETAETERSLLVGTLIALGRVLVGILVVALGVTALGALYLAAVVHLQERRRRERRARTTDARGHVGVAWAECLDALRPLGLVPQHAESHDEFAARVAPRLGDAGPDLMALAEAVDHADYASGVGEDVAAVASTAATTVIETAGTLATPMQEWLDRLDPRRLLSDGRAREPHRTISSRWST